MTSALASSSSPEGGAQAEPAAHPDPVVREVRRGSCHGRGLLAPPATVGPAGTTAAGPGAVR